MMSYELNFIFSRSMKKVNDLFISENLLIQYAKCEAFKEHNN